MIFKDLIFVSVIFSFLFVSCNQASKDKSNQFETIEITWIETPDSISHFESLLSTNHLYYLRHMSVDYDSYAEGTWKYNDIVANDKWTMTRERRGMCKESRDSLKTEFCMAWQKHVINKELNKVINFLGGGSGYAANIYYIYDESGKLIEYNENNSRLYYLKYNAKDQLVEVEKTETRNGMKKKTGLIKFK